MNRTEQQDGRICKSWLPYSATQLLPLPHACYLSRNNGIYIFSFVHNSSPDVAIR